MNDLLCVKNLCRAAECYGVDAVLALFGGPLDVRLPMSAQLWETPVAELRLSVRAQNGLMRASADTVGKVATCIMEEGGLGKVRNLGKKSVAEIQTALLLAGYEQLTPAERMAFWQDVLQRNDLSRMRERADWDALR